MKISEGLMKKTVVGAFVFFVIGSLVGSLAYFLPKKTNETPEQVKKAMEQINEMLKPQGETASLISWTEEKWVYKFDLKIGEQQFQSFVTKDGKYLFPYGIELSQAGTQRKEETQKTEEEQTPQEGEVAPSIQVEKRERPDVKIFVMSYCPFGVQMEKALLPAWKLLKDKADIGIYFVSYIMHGRKEMEENLRQYCIQKEEKDKYLTYLECFVEKGNSEECVKKAEIDENKLKYCQELTDKEFKISENFTEQGFPPFNVHKELNEKYGVRGSPTVVINDKEVRVVRSPEGVKRAICEAFLIPPPECEQKLSEETASAGFGAGVQASSEGGCR